MRVLDVASLIAQRDTSDLPVRSSDLTRLRLDATRSSRSGKIGLACSCSHQLRETPSGFLLLQDKLRIQTLGWHETNVFFVEMRKAGICFQQLANKDLLLVAGAKKHVRCLICAELGVHWLQCKETGVLCLEFEDLAVTFIKLLQGLGLVGREAGCRSRWLVKVAEMRWAYAL
jgi:hypothetical protein